MDCGKGQDWTWFVRRGGRRRRWCPRSRCGSLHRSEKPHTWQARVPHHGLLIECDPGVVKRSVRGPKASPGPTKSPSWRPNVLPRVRWRFVNVHAREVRLYGRGVGALLTAQKPPSAARPWRRRAKGPSSLRDVDETDRERGGSGGMEGAVGSCRVGAEDGETRGASPRREARPQMKRDQRKGPDSKGSMLEGEKRAGWRRLRGELVCNRRHSGVQCRACPGPSPLVSFLEALAPSHGGHRSGRTVEFMIHHFTTQRPEPPDQVTRTTWTSKDTANNGARQHKMKKCDTHR